MSGGRLGKNTQNSTAAVSLRVSGTYNRDWGPGVIGIDDVMMRSIGASPGAIVEILGKKRALAKVAGLHPSDSGRMIARIDSDTRNNAGIRVGATVVIRLIPEPPQAEKVILIPLRSVPEVEEDRLSDDLIGIPLTIGCEINIWHLGERIPFKVKEIIPLKPAMIDIQAGLVTTKTVFVIKTI
jgi:transitional endoplasmic reticulum ATPase